MSRMARRANLSPKGGGGGKTYAEFQAHITGLSSGVVAFSALLTTQGAGEWKTTADGDGAGAMRGTPWGGLFRRNTFPYRVARHGLPSEEVYYDQITNGRDLLFNLTLASDGGTVGFDRNGYASLTDATSQPRYICTRILYWDGTQAQEMNPSTSTGPTPYTW